MLSFIIFFPSTSFTWGFLIRSIHRLEYNKASSRFWGMNISPILTLELARTFLLSALTYNFLLGKELNCIPPLSKQVSKEPLLPTTERKESHWSIHADIDANIT